MPPAHAMRPPPISGSARRAHPSFPGNGRRRLPASVARRRLPGKASMPSPLDFQAYGAVTQGATSRRGGTREDEHRGPSCHVACTAVALSESFWH
jgi:hypothetical protein